MKVSSNSFDPGERQSRLPRKWSSDQASDQSSNWESFLRLWDRAHLLRSFLWTQEIDDEKTLVKQFLMRLRQFFTVDFCFVALFLNAGKVLQLGLPEASTSKLPANFVRQALDLIAHSRAPVTWKQFSKDSGFKSVVLSPLSPAVGQPLGFFMFGHARPKNFTRSELFLLQSLSSEFSWAIRELRSKQTYQKVLAGLSHELKNSLNVIIGDCTLLEEKLEASLAQEQRQALASIQTTSQEILTLVNSFLDSTLLHEGKAVVIEENIELVPVVNDVLSSREKPNTAAVALTVDYAKDLPKEIATDLLRFRHIVRNLADYAIEHAEQRSTQIDVKKNGEWLELTVTGLREHKVEKAIDSTLEPEVCGHPTDTDSGTGLKLIKEDLDLLMGHLHVISRPGEDGSITVCLPCQ